MASYGQYCPISRTADLLGDRWTIHIIRDLMTGASRFNELANGNPGLSRGLLSRRLRQLVNAGVVEHEASGGYRLTDAGKDLESIVFGLATWGARWTFGDPAPDELDPDVLMWWLHRRLDAEALAAPRFVVQVTFTDHRKRYWIVVEDEASLCLADPRFDVDVMMRTDLTTLYRSYLGRVSLEDSVRAGTIELTGSNKAVRSFTRSFRQSPVASIVAREAPG